MAFSFKEVLYDGRLVSVPISPYPYQPCQPSTKQLRFIRVLPTDDDDEVIRCQLFHELLDKVEYFAALSYEWGDPSACGIIIIDDIEVPVTINLLEALKHLRQADCPVLWIDALCINQEDNHDKNAHLAMMKDIYHDANMVCAYIGPAADESDRVMELLRAIDMSRRSNSARGVITPWTPNASQLASREAELKAFFSRSYWHRVWIIQEIAVSSNLCIFCGPSSVRWIAFEVLVPLLLNSYQFQQMDRTINYLSQMRMKRLQKTPTGLLQLLNSSHFAKATNPRDRVYALLGLCFDGAEYVNEPHYDWTEAAICLNITKTVIAKRRSLDIIFAKTAPSALNLPSWCPDYFSSPSEKVWARMAAYITGSDEKFRMGRKSTKWTATNNSVATRQDLIIRNDRNLTVRGFSLGIVDSIGCTLSDPPGMVPRASSTAKMTYANTSVDPYIENAENRLFVRINRVLNMYCRPESTSESSSLSEEELGGTIDNSYIDTKLYYNLYSFGRFYSSFFGPQQRYETEFEKIRDWRSRNENLMIRGDTFKKRANGLNASMESGQLAEVSYEFVSRQLFSAAATVVSKQVFNSQGRSRRPRHARPSQNRRTERMPPHLEGALVSLSDLIDEDLRLVTTDSGHIGWAHQSTQLGDHIYLLQACSMPVVLRPSQPDYDLMNVNANNISTGDDIGDDINPFTVVGHGIVAEAMDGTLWSNLTRNAAEEWVTLK